MKKIILSLLILISLSNSSLNGMVFLSRGFNLRDNYNCADTIFREASNPDSMLNVITGQRALDTLNLIKENPVTTMGCTFVAFMTFKDLFDEKSWLNQLSKGMALRAVDWVGENPRIAIACAIVPLFLGKSLWAAIGSKTKSNKEDLSDVLKMEKATQTNSESDQVISTGIYEVSDGEDFS
jgi:hypothetical protein